MPGLPGDTDTGVQWVRNPDTRTIQSAYEEIETYLPKVPKLAENEVGWYLGRLLIGETDREAAAYLRGVRDGMSAYLLTS
jgi:hypothetical protein